MTKRSVLLTAVPLALLAVCAAVLLLACGTVLSQEYLSARPDSTVEAAVPFYPTKSSILRGPAIAAFLRKCSAAPHRGPRAICQRGQCRARRRELQEWSDQSPSHWGPRRAQRGGEWNHVPP